MRYFATDTGFLLHPKAFLAGRDGRDLWSAAGQLTARDDGDGFVVRRVVPQYASIAGVPKPARATDLLIESGLWHDHETIADCAKCLHGDGHQDGWQGLGGLDSGLLYFHDWRDYQLAKVSSDDPAWRKFKDRQRKQLNRPGCEGLRLFVRARDANRCQYCGVLCVFDFTTAAGRNAPDAGWLDHVDPRLAEPTNGNIADNLVVACKTCNESKRDRTPEDAGMPLLSDPRPRTPAGRVRGRSGTSPGHVGGHPRTSDGLSSRDARAGTVRGQSGDGPVDMSADTTTSTPRGAGERNGR